ncbi:MAG: hypothetical protein E7257_06850 [Lachnospiraceae bacterium]|nr:hypothetical protein [Lachnospiraceae bacterium]
MEISYGLNPDSCQHLHIEPRGNMNVFRANFKSLSQLHLFLNANPTVNTNIFYTQKSINSSAKFAGEPLDVAIGYCVGGYEKDFSMFVKLKKDIDRVNIRHVHSRKVRPSVVGSRPNVPAYVAGAPKSMYRMDRVREKKFITIYINLAYANDTSEDQIRNRGILTLNLIKILENNDYGVNLKVFETCMVGREVFAATIGISRPGELLNVKKCYYPLCGKEFLRRVMCRIKESMPFKENWHMSYGQLLSDKHSRIIMDIPEDAIVIGSPAEMGILGADIYEDADRFLEKLNLNKEIVVPSYVKESKEEETR